VSSTIRTAELIDAVRATARLKQRYGDAEWPRRLARILAARLAQARVPFVALVPYPLAALPRPMLDRIAVVQWDRPATVSSVQRAAARARGR
jgi:hypothetical protein